MIWTCLKSSFRNKAIAFFKLWEERWVLCTFLKKEEKKVDSLHFTTFKCKNPLQKVQVHSPQNEYREKCILLGKIWKYFLSFLRSCGELWLQQTWEMTVVTECLGKGLFYAKELSWFGMKSKEPLCLWGWTVCCFLLAKHDEVQPMRSPALFTPHPGREYVRLYHVNRYADNLAIFEDWNQKHTTNPPTQSAVFHWSLLGYR